MLIELVLLSALPLPASSLVLKQSSAPKKAEVKLLKRVATVHFACAVLFFGFYIICVCFYRKGNGVIDLVQVHLFIAVRDDARTRSAHQKSVL